MKKQILWAIVFAFGACLFWLCALVPIEVFLGIDMPWVNISIDEFRIFGYDIAPDKQIGILLLSGILIMLPVRIIHLAALKLSPASK